MSNAFSGGNLKTPHFIGQRTINKHQSFLFLSPLASPAVPTTSQISSMARQTLCFSSPKDLLQFVTSNWRENFVTCDLDKKDLVEMFIRRPFFMLVSVDAPLMDRFSRSR